MFQDEDDKYSQADEQFYEEMMQWMESEHAYELSEEDINEMEREQINRSLTAKTFIISQTPINDKYYQPIKSGA